MPWVRLDEDFASHPKVLEAGPLGMALQVAALCYANRHLTDGRIPRAAARSLLDFEGIAVIDGMVGNDVEADYVIGCLLEAGLWHGVDHDCETCPQVERGYIIHDYLEQQPSRDEVLAKREQTAAAGRKGGQARAKRTVKRPASETLSEPSSESPSETEANVQAESKPVPVPVPVPQEHKVKGARRAPELPLPDDWEPNTKHHDIATEEGIDCQREAEQFRDHAAANDRRQRDWDAAFRTWLRSPYAKQSNGTARGSPGAKGGQYADRYRQVAAELERQGR